VEGSPRASNTHPRLSGDPERWGAHSTAEVAIAAAASPGDFVVYSQQMLRAETRDLVAIGWDLLVVSSITGLNVADRGFLALELTIGTGQANSILLLLCGNIVAGVLASQNPAALAQGYSPVRSLGLSALADAQRNVAISGSPIVATSLSARAVLAITSGAAHTLKLDVNAHCAPRSWVP